MVQEVHQVLRRSPRFARLREGSYRISQRQSSSLQPRGDDHEHIVEVHTQLVKLKRPDLA